MDDGGATAAGSLLPRDAIFDILTWAPFKSVCRFRCVSKDWLALISGLAFIAQHRSRSGSLLVGSYCIPYDGGLRVMDVEGNVLRTIKGLGAFPSVASSVGNLVSVHCTEAPGVRLVDVTTGKVLLTSPTLGSSKLHAVSLGRAAVSNSCKAIRITESFSYNGEYGVVQSQQTCEVLTLGHDDSEWRQAPSPPALVRMHNFIGSTAAVNGAMHFLSQQEPVGNSVLCFDLESEEWGKTIEGPLKEDTELWGQTGLIHITQLKDTLCMIQTEKHKAEQRTNIWLLVDADNSVWMKAYAIPMPMSVDMVQPLMIMADGVKLLTDYHTRRSLVPVLRVYDPSTGIFTDAVKLPENTFGRVCLCDLHLHCFGAGKI
ncbi:F-box/kelch-repeat protein At4g19930-like [Aegilops tauschii subsp. strangulata]|nr:F-box/kelch-repeat protein At2g43445-like [Aegilops tauschii subsp. strangulata]